MKATDKNNIIPIVMLWNPATGKSILSSRSFKKNLNKQLSELMEN